MKVSKEPECKEHPHIKVKKKLPGKKAISKAQKSIGMLYKNVTYEIREVSGHQRVMDNHKYTAIITIKDTNQIKLAFPVWPKVEEMRREYKAWKARMPKMPKN